MALFEPQIVHLKNGLTVELRPARVSEASRLLSAFIEITDTSPYILSTPESARRKTVEEQERWISNANEDPRAALIVAVCEGRIVGIANTAAFKDSKRAHRAGLGMSVVQDFRGQGLGEALMEKLLEVAGTMEGVLQLELNVMAANRPAIQLYKKMGFKEVGLYPKAYLLEGEGWVDDITMYLEL